MAKPKKENDAKAGEASALRDATLQQPSRKRERDSADDHEAKRRYVKVEAPAFPMNNTVDPSELVPGKLPRRAHWKATPSSSKLARSTFEEEDASSENTNMAFSSRVPKIRPMSAFRPPSAVSREQENGEGETGVMSGIWYGTNGANARAAGPGPAMKPASSLYNATIPSDDNEGSLFMRMSIDSPNLSRNTVAESSSQGGNHPASEMDVEVSIKGSPASVRKHTPESLNNTAMDDSVNLNFGRPVQELSGDEVVSQTLYWTRMFEESVSVSGKNMAEAMKFHKNVAVGFMDLCRKDHDREKELSDVKMELAEFKKKQEKHETKTNSELRFLFNLIQGRQQSEVLPTAEES